jgi:hypothetical protein
VLSDSLNGYQLIRNGTGAPVPATYATGKINNGLFSGGPGDFLTGGNFLTADPAFTFGDA